jgi:hypothetical protein
MFLLNRMVFDNETDALFQNGGHPSLRNKQNSEDLFVNFPTVLLNIGSRRKFSFHSYRRFRFPLIFMSFIHCFFKLDH